MKKLLLPLVFLLTLFAQAQEEETPSWTDGFTLSGSLDAYFRQNLNADYREAPGSSFANQPGFALGMANAILSYESGDVGGVADLVFGPRGTDAVFAATTASSTIVNQLYVYWNVSDVVTLTFGNFNTFLGYEVISPTGNFNYSTSYAFSYGPFSHTGLKADFAIDDNWSALVAIMNPTDAVDFNPTNTYTFGGQLGYSSDTGSTFLNLLYGDQDGDFEESADATFQIDLTTGYNLSEEFYLGLNATYNTTSLDEGTFGYDSAGFYGAALYAQYAVSDSFALGIRPEYFSEFGEFGAVPGAFNMEGETSVFAFTFSANATVGPLTFIPEIRFDSPSEDGAFLNGDEESIDSLSSFVLAAVYSF
ncbi:MAG: porin [Leeuwenhoekiella sp.]